MRIDTQRPACIIAQPAGKSSSAGLHGSDSSRNCLPASHSASLQDLLPAPPVRDLSIRLPFKVRVPDLILISSSNSVSSVLKTPRPWHHGYRWSSRLASSSLPSQRISRTCKVSSAGGGLGDDFGRWCRRKLRKRLTVAASILTMFYLNADIMKEIKRSGLEVRPLHRSRGAPT